MPRPAKQTPRGRRRGHGTPPARSARPRVALIAAIASGLTALLVVAIIVLVHSSGGETRASIGPPTPSPDPLVSIPPAPSVAPSPTIPAATDLPTALLYVEPGDSGASVKRLDLRTGDVTELYQTQGAQVVVPATGARVAYVMTRLASGEEVPPGSGGGGTPVVHVADLRTGTDIEVGEGSGPVWSSDGSRLAAYRSTADGHTVVVAMTMADPHLAPVTDPSTQWTILGWAGDRVLLFGIPFRMYLVALDGASEIVPTPDAVIRDPSPDGRWVFALSHQGDAVFLRLGERVPVVIDLGPWQLGASYWTANDLIVVAAATGTAIDAPSTVLVLDPQTGSMLEVPHTDGAVAAIPSLDGGSFVLARGKFPPTWTLSTCVFDGSCTEAGKVRIGVVLAQVT